MTIPSLSKDSLLKDKGTGKRETPRSLKDLRAAAKKMGRIERVVTV